MQQLRSLKIQGQWPCVPNGLLLWSVISAACPDSHRSVRCPDLDGVELAIVLETSGPVDEFILVAQIALDQMKMGQVAGRHRVGSLLSHGEVVFLFFLIKDASAALL